MHDEEIRPDDPYLLMKNWPLRDTHGDERGHLHALTGRESS